jgi:hypothetical protein
MPNSTTTVMFVKDKTLTQHQYAKRGVEGREEVTTHSKVRTCGVAAVGGFRAVGLRPGVASFDRTDLRLVDIV